MPKLIVKWKSMHDNKVCPICRDLDESGYEWVIDGAQPMPDYLEHPKWGVVWDRSRGSRAHEKAYNYAPCRCQFDIDSDIADLVVWLTRIRDRLKAMAEVKQQ